MTVKQFLIIFMTLKLRAIISDSCLSRTQLAQYWRMLLLLRFYYTVTSSLTLLNGEMGSISFPFQSGWPCGYYGH